MRPTARRMRAVSCRRPDIGTTLCVLACCALRNVRCTIVGFSTVDISAVSIGTTTNRFFGACTAGNGKIVLVPNDASAIGIFDASASSFSTLSSFTGSNHFFGCATLSDGRVVLAPGSEASIAIVDSTTSSTSSIDTSATNTGGNGNKFIDAAVDATGQVIFAPKNSDYVWRVDASAGSYAQIATGWNSVHKFGGVARAGNDAMIFAPGRIDGLVGVYVPSTDAFSTVNVSASFTADEMAATKHVLANF